MTWTKLNDAKWQDFRFFISPYQMACYVDEKSSKTEKDVLVTKGNAENLETGFGCKQGRDSETKKTKKWEGMRWVDNPIVDSLYAFDLVQYKRTF